MLRDDPSRIDGAVDEIIRWATPVRLFLRELLARLDSLQLAAEPPHVVSNFVGGIKNLPLRYRLRPAQ